MAIIDNGDGTNRIRGDDHAKAVTDEQLQRALSFYTNAPDGQYDHDVVVPLIEAELIRRGKGV